MNIAARNNNIFFIPDFLLGSLFGLMHGLIVAYVNLRVPEPYMDEYFHIQQTRLYCQGIFNQWNPMITTPPALYLLTLITGLCGNERFINSLLLPICFAGISRLRRKNLLQNEVQNLDQLKDVWLPTLSIILLPVLLDTSVLFYTDLLSLSAAIWGIGSACPFHSFFAFSIAIFSRQNNIVWAALYCFRFAWDALTKFLLNELTIVAAALQLLRRTFLHLMLAAAFAYFVFIWNDGSIVLGDKSAHQPVFHPPQLLYFFAFTMASTFPLFVAYLMTELSTRSFSRLCQSPLASFLVILSLLSLAAAAVHCCTMAHPYLLADNRHFTFYLWQRLFQRHWLIKYAFVPFYVISAVFMMEMATLMTNVEKISFLTATSLCLIPAKLLEFRYFIIPFALWRCSVHKKEGKNSVWAKCNWFVMFTEIGLHILINIFALYLFLERPFQFVMTDGNKNTNDTIEWQRFMW